MFQIDRTIDLTQHSHSHPRQGHTSGERTSHSRSAVNASSRFPLQTLLSDGCRLKRFGQEGSGQRRPEVISTDCILFVFWLSNLPCVSGGLEELETSKKRGSLYQLLERIRRFGLGKNLSSVLTARDHSFGTIRTLKTSTGCRPLTV